MNGRVFSSRFSMTHMSGSKCSMISRRRGRIVRARLYSVQTGLAQTMSKCPGGGGETACGPIVGSNFDDVQ